MPLSVVYATDAKIEPRVKVVGVFPDNPHDPIVYPAAATVNAKPGTTQYLRRPHRYSRLRLFGARKAHIERVIEDFAP